MNATYTEATRRAALRRFADFVDGQLPKSHRHFGIDGSLESQKYVCRASLEEYWQSQLREESGAAINDIIEDTIVLIRLIEGFKIIDMPNILLGGGPGTATQTLALESYFSWRTLDLGRSAAIAYLLLITVTIVATAYGSLVRRRAELAA